MVRLTELTRRFQRVRCVVRARLKFFSQKLRSASAEEQPGHFVHHRIDGRVVRLHGLIQSLIVHLIPRQRIPRQRVLRPRFRRRFIMHLSPCSIASIRPQVSERDVRIHKFRPMFQRQLVTLPRHLESTRRAFRERLADAVQRGWEILFRAQRGDETRQRLVELASLQVRRRRGVRATMPRVVIGTRTDVNVGQHLRRSRQRAAPSSVDAFDR